MPPQQSTLAWSIVISVLHVVAIVSTTFRLWHRVHKRQMWYDDYVAIVPLAFDCVYFVIFWMALTSKDYLRYRNNAHFVTSFMFGVIVNAIVLWFSRISLALSLARIFPRGHVARRLSMCIAALCFVFFGTTVGLTIGLCQGDGRAWYRIDPHNCKKGPKDIPVNGIVGVVADILADTVLFLAPLFVLRRVRLPARERRMIVAAFSGSVLTLLAAVVFGVFWYCRVNLGSAAGKVVLRLVIANIETTVALIVCNLLVITMFFYRIFRRIHSMDAAAPKRAPLAAVRAMRANPPLPVPLPSDTSGSSRSTSGDAVSASASASTSGSGAEDPRRIICGPSLSQLDGGGPSMSMSMSMSSVVTPITLTQLDTAGMVWDTLDAPAPVSGPARSSALTLEPGYVCVVDGCVGGKTRGDGERERKVEGDGGVGCEVRIGSRDTRHVTEEEEEEEKEGKKEGEWCGSNA